MILHVHKDKTDELDLKSRLNEFVEGMSTEVVCLDNINVLS